MNTKLSSRLVLIVISALFILPLILAWLMFNGAIGIKPGSVRSFGELVHPPVAVDWQNSLVAVPGGSDAGYRENTEIFSGHWVVVHVVPPDCQSSCQNAIYGLRQVHRASGRNQHRIRIALLLQGASLPETVTGLSDIYSQFHLFESPGGTIQPVLEAIAGNFSAGSGGSSYLIDPIGNIMMYYAAGSDPNNLKKDLKRLLKWSKLDK